MMNKELLLSVQQINKYFKKSGRMFHAVNNATFDVFKGDFFGIIGESGSGKSTIGKMIIRLLEVNSGYILFDNNLISNKKIDKKLNSWLCQNMQMVFQDPMGSLNPRKNVINLVSEPLRIHKIVEKEAVQYIANANKINQFFQYTYRQKDFELSKEFDDYYFTNMIEIYKQGIQRIEMFKYNKDFTIEENQFDFISCLLELDEKAKKVNYSLYDYSEKVKRIFLDCLEIHSKRENHPAEVALFDIDQEIKEQKQYLKGPKNLYELKKELSNIKEQLSTHLIESTERYTAQVHYFLKGIEQGMKADIAVLTDKFRGSANLIECLKTQYSILVDHLMIKNIKEFIKVDVLDIKDSKLYLEHVEKLVTDKVEYIYTRITKLAEDLKASRQLLNPELEQEYKDIIDAIKNEQKSESNIFDHQSYEYASRFSSYNIRQHDKKITLHLQNRIYDLQNEIKGYSKSGYKNSEEYNANLKKYNELVAERERINNQCQEHYKGDIAEFDQNIAPKIEAHKTTLINYEKELKQLKKDYIKAVKEKMKDVCKEVKNISVEEYKTFNLSFKNEVINKLKTIDALTFEFETILEEVVLYRNLRSPNKFFVKMQKKELVKIMTRIKVYSALNAVGLKNEHAYRYPHEFSGGQRQRIVIARALISNPKLIIADEPISALDVSIQAQVINIMRELAEKKGITFLFVAHDLSMVNYSCNRMIIMHNGRILEKGDTKEIFNNPIHPYTISLLKAAPQLSKIHIDLASFSLSDSGYNSNDVDDSISEFYKIPGSEEHYVYGTEGQVEQWIKMSQTLD